MFSELSEVRAQKNSNYRGLSFALHILDRLVGMIRVVGDGRSILFIQDLLVLSKHRRRRIGSNLVKQVLTKFNTVRQKVLLTDDTPQIRAFYESIGFLSCDRVGMAAFVRFK